MTRVVQVQSRMYVNVGDRTTFGRFLNEDEVRAAFGFLGVEIEDLQHFDNEGAEGTYAVAVSGLYAKPVYRDLAMLLQQDCVAVLFTVHGYLAGHKAREWGPFKPELFRMPDGSTFAERLPA